MKSKKILKMMPFIFATWLQTFLYTSSALCKSKDPQVYYLNDDGFILDGYDAVSYFNTDDKNKEPLKGDVKYQTEYDGAKFKFASEENKQEFLKNPKKFVPAFGGWCAYAVADSKSKVTIDAKSFLIQDGRLLLFYNGIWGDTKKEWLSPKNKGKEAYLKEADANWPELKDKAP